MSPGERVLSNKKSFWIIFLLITGSFFVSMCSKNENAVSTPQPRQETSRSCVRWANQYAIIPHDSFPNDTLQMGREEAWLITLSSREWSGWIVTNSHYSGESISSIEIEASDGLRITSKPRSGRSPINIGNNRNVFRIRSLLSNNCVLISTD